MGGGIRAAPGSTAGTGSEQRTAGGAGTGGGGDGGRGGGLPSHVLSQYLIHVTRHCMTFAFGPLARERTHAPTHTRTKTRTHPRTVDHTAKAARAQPCTHA